MTDFKSYHPTKLGYMRGNDFVNWVHEALFDHLGCPKTTHRPMCDNANRMSNEHNLSDKRPWINYQEADYILHFGMNEVITSYGQRKTAQLKAAVDRGAKLVVLDPRRSETAALATEWIPIKPSTDAAVALAMCHVIIKNGLYDKEFVSNWTSGFEDFKKRVMGEDDDLPKTPLWASRISGVPAETIERIALEFAKATAKGAMSWTGLAQVPNGMSYCDHIEQQIFPRQALGTTQAPANQVLIGLALLTNATNLLVFTAGGLSREGAPIIPGSVTLLGFVQYPLSGVLIFLLLLAIRNHFRIK